jgi:hypothetical protein
MKVDRQHFLGAGFHLSYFNSDKMTLLLVDGNHYDYAE